VDPASQVVSSVSKNATTLTVSDSSAFVVDGRYWLCADSGRGYYVEVADVATGVLTLRDPVRFAITTGKIVGARITGALAADDVGAPTRNLRLVWSYVIGGVTYRRRTLIDVVRWPFDVDFSESDVERLSTQFGELAGRFGSWRKLREGAVDAIWSDLRAANREPDKMSDRSVLKMAGCYKLLQLRALGDDVAFASLGDLYDHEIKNALSDNNAWYDADGDLNVDTETGATGDADEISGGPPNYIGVG